MIKEEMVLREVMPGASTLHFFIPTFPLDYHPFGFLPVSSSPPLLIGSHSGLRASLTMRVQFLLLTFVLSSLPFR